MALKDLLSLINDSILLDGAGNKEVIAEGEALDDLVGAVIAASMIAEHD